MDVRTLQQLQLENQRLREQLAERDRLIDQRRQTIRDLQKRLEEVERSVRVSQISEAEFRVS